MSYIGNPIVSTDFPVDYASGNGSTTAFTLSVAPASVNSIDVQISGVSQSPQTYSVSGTTLTFSAAPPTGTNNIVVRHLGVAGIPNTPSAGSVVPSSIGTGYSLWNLSGSDINYTAGNVQIGTTTSYGELTVSSGTTTGVYVDATNEAVKSNLTSGVLSLREAGGSSANNGVELHLRPSSGKSAWITFTENAVADKWAIGTANGNNSLLFKSGSFNGTERMSIDSSGTLLVGKTGASLNSIGFQVQPTNAFGATVNGGPCIDVNRQNSNGSIVRFYRGVTGTLGSSVGSIDVTSTATSYVTSSDYRLKENVAPMQNALNVVQQLKPVTYSWKLDGSDGQGFIAHELQAVVPDCVTGEKDAVDEEGNPVYQGIDTSFLVATLTAAIQELKAELDATKAEVTALKARA